MADVCKAGRLLAYRLDQRDRAVLRGWLANGQDGKGRRVSAVTMANALCAAGHVVGPTTLKDHRAGRCVCYRERVTA